MTMTKVKTEEGLIRFGDWTGFNEKIMGIQEHAFQSEEKLCEEMELDYELYKKIIGFAVNSWKDSPSKSLFHAIGKSGLTIPEEGGVVFDNYIAQTRFFLMLSEARLIIKFDLRTVRDEKGDKVKVKGEYALTYPDGSKREYVSGKVERILQYIYMYFLYCKKQEEKEGFKKSKKIYRGIRFSDILWSPAIKEALSTLDLSENGNNREAGKVKYECIVDYLKKNGIEGICENHLVSFTSSKTIAKYFADNNGIVVEMNSDDIEIMTSEVHDARFAERDYVSNKLEKEYIARVGGTKAKVSDILITDLDYLIATNDPLAVSKFDHNNKSATYELNGINIKAYFVWTSNTTSSIYYKNVDVYSFGLSSQEFKKEYGFSPTPTSGNCKNINNFQIHIS